MTTITVLGTGGTISCVHDDQGDLVPTLTTQQLVDQALQLQPVDNHVELRSQDIMQLDSSSISLADIDHILDSIRQARAAGADAVIVTHGTDSMEETAMAAALLLADGYPVIFTGAQRPADDKQPDGPENIRGAIKVAQQWTEASPATLIHFGGATLPAYGATKWDTSATNAFVNVESSAARVEPAIDGVNLRNGGSNQVAKIAGLRVDLLYTYAGAGEELHSSDADGLVIAAMGSGNIPATMLPLVKRFDGPVLICTRVPNGGVRFVYGGSGGGAQLHRLGAENAGALSPAQARMALLCRIAINR